MRKAANNTGVEIKGFGPVDYIKITILGFALAALWSSLHTIVIPLRLLDFVAETQKNTYLGIITGTGLLLAMAIQPMAGAISDRSGFRWGLRRPYILLGIVLTILLLPGIGLCGSYLTLLIICCLLQVSSNTALGPHQAFIPDLVPKGKWGQASGVKNLLEFAGGLVIVRLIAYLMDRYLTEQGGPWLGYTLAILIFVLLVTMLITILTVKEKPRDNRSRLSLLPMLYRSFKIDSKANRDFVWFLISRLLILTAFSTLQKFALYFFMDVVGITSPAAATANLLIVLGGCMLIAVYPAGRLSDKVGRKPIIVSSAMVSALGTLLLFFFQSHGFIMLCGALLGLSFGTFMSTNWALATDLVAKGEEARYLGLTNLATAGASALSLFLIGPLIDYFNNYNTGLGYRIMFLTCFLCLITGSLLVLKVREQSQPK
jgi:Na+/melibiose symporter-like transporter